MQEANVSRSAVEAFAHTSPYIKKWTKNTIGTLITVGGLGASPVGTPQTVADELERWVDEADVDGFNFVSDLDRCSMLGPPTSVFARGFF